MSDHQVTGRMIAFSAMALLYGLGFMNGWMWRDMGHTGLLGMFYNALTPAAGIGGAIVWVVWSRSRKAPSP